MLNWIFSIYFLVIWFKVPKIDTSELICKKYRNIYFMQANFIHSLLLLGSMAYENRKIKVLFICAHNSVRSQIAEEYLKHIGGNRFRAESAGIKPSGLDPVVIELMGEEGYDMRRKRSRSAWNLFRQGEQYNFVINVCNRELDDEWPVFQGPFAQLNWPFPDPGTFSCNGKSRTEQMRELRDAIRKRVEQFVSETTYFSCGAE